MRVTSIRVRFETKNTEKFDYIINMVELESNLEPTDDPVKELQKLQLMAWKSMIKKRQDKEGS